MAAIGNNRRAQIRRNISGGTTAPASAAKGYTTGLGAAQAVTQMGLGQNKPVTGLSTPTQPGAPPPVTPLPWDVAAANSVAAAAKVEEQARTNGGQCRFNRRRLRIDPIRVG